jgi:hypothetical protein
MLDAFEEGVKKTVARTEDLLSNLASALPKQGEEWFQQLLCGLLRSALVDYDGLRHAGTLNCAAWCARNLLELRVTGDYVLSSSTRAEDFRNDLSIDARELYEALTQHHKTAHEKTLTLLKEQIDQEEGTTKEVLQAALAKSAADGPQTHETEGLAQSFASVMKEYGIPENTKPTRVSAMAQELTQRATFNPLFRISSKFTHRSTLAIAAANTEASLDALRPFLLSAGTLEFIALFTAVNTHAAVRGITPPST